MRIGKHKGQNHVLRLSHCTRQDYHQAARGSDCQFHSPESRADVRSAITALAKIVREEMLSGRTVDLTNLGSFKVVSNGKRVETEKAVTAETLKTPRIQFFPNSKCAIGEKRTACGDT